MATVEISDAEKRRLAMDWIEEQQQETNGYRVVLETLLGNAHTARWAWTDALRFAITLCSKRYAVQRKHVLELIAK